LGITEGYGRLRIFKRQIYRKIYDSVIDNTTWCIRYNKELLKLYKKPEIINVED
jgi:hypothetical protein